MASDQVRTYDRPSSIVFLKTDEPFGGLSNMAGGFPLQVGGTRILTAEALYQACRFPHLPEVQRLIIEQKSPMTAKMKSKPHRKNSRPDWDWVRVNVMRWCLRVKLAQNWAKFSELLVKTGERPIVEESRRDDFWGAKPVDVQTLVGMNALGRLLMELREVVKSQGRAAFRVVEPPDIPELLLFGRPIGPIREEDEASQDNTRANAVRIDERRSIQEPTAQESLFDLPCQVEYSVPAPSDFPDSECALFDSLKPYSEMKDSEVPWLKEVPAHWEILPNRALFEEVKERNHPDEEMLSVTITKGVIRQQSLLSESSKKDSSNLDKSAYKLIRPGDVAYNKMRAWQGAIGASKYRGIISPAYVVQRPRGGMDARYVHYLFRTPAFAKEAERCSYGITSDMWSLRPEHFKLIYSCLPPSSEQSAIVRYLDYVDRRVRRLVRAKRKLISLLNERKQAIIHQAVTRGLDPDVPMKDSGVDWLGEVPKHWNMLRAKYLYREVDERSSTGDEELLSVSHITGVTPRKKNVYMFLAKSNVGHKICRPGDLAINTMWAYMGALGVAHQIGLVSPSYGVYRPKDPGRMNPEYFDVLLRTSSYTSEYLCRSTGITSSRLRLYPEAFLKIPLVCPPIKEQEAISAHLKSETAGIEHAIGRTNREIELLQEYRTRLVADVVTGKLDVRDAAAALPDEDPLEAADGELPEVRAGDEEDLGELDGELEEAEA